MKYFVFRDGQVSGPFSKQQVLAEIKSKKLRKTDLLGTSAKGPWKRVEDALGKKPKASTAKTPVESEAHNKQGNASAGEVDDSWDSADDFGDSTDDFGDLPDLPDARTFYIERNKKVAGPYSVKQIEAAIRSGKLREADSFSDSRTGPWMKLRAFYRIDGQIRNELTYVVKSRFFSRKKVSYQCPRCDASLWSSLSEAGNDDSCPECQTQFSVPGTDALRDYQRASDDSVVVTPRRVKARSQESAEQSRKFFKQIVIGVLVVTIGPLLFFTALELSKPYKLKWAADSAAERSEFYTAAHSQLLADMRHDDDNSDRAWKKVKRMGDRAEEAITELGLILEEMTPHGRKAWAESQIDKKMEKFHSR